MRLQDEFRAIIATAQTEVEERRLSVLPAKEWEEEFKAIVSEILDDACNAFVSSEIPCTKMKYNGNGTMLQVPPPRYLPGSPEHDIRFSFRKEAIQVFSTESELCALWERGQVTKAVLISILNDFLRRVALAYPQKPPIDPLKMRGLF